MYASEILRPLLFKQFAAESVRYSNDFRVQCLPPNIRLSGFYEYTLYLGRQTGKTHAICSYVFSNPNSVVITCNQQMKRDILKRLEHCGWRLVLTIEEAVDYFRTSNLQFDVMFIDEHTYMRTDLYMQLLTILGNRRTLPPHFFILRVGTPVYDESSRTQGTQVHS